MSNVRSSRTVKEQALDRIALARQRKDFGRYVEFGSMGIEKVHCKMCGIPIRKLVADDRYTDVREIKGKQVHVERLVLMTLSSYVELKILFDDNSNHVTCLCQTCAAKATLDDIDWCYCADLNEWMLDGSAAADSFWERQVARKPASFIVYPPGTVAP